MNNTNGAIRVLLSCALLMQISEASDPRSVVTGIVTDLGNRPVQGAVVHCEYSNRSATTGPDGAFSIEIEGSTGITRFSNRNGPARPDRPKRTVALFRGKGHDADVVYDMFGRKMQLRDEQPNTAPRIVVGIGGETSPGRPRAVAQQTSSTKPAKPEIRMV